MPRKPFASTNMVHQGDSIGLLPQNVLSQLTHLLYMNAQIDYHAPPYTWLQSQLQRSLRLDKTLLKPKSLLERFAILAFRHKIQLPGLRECAELCAAHRELDPRLVRALMVLVGDEVTVRVDRYRRLREDGELPDATSAWLYRIDSVSLIWMGKYRFERRFGYAAPENATGITQRCEACILSVVGGRPQLLSDLRANMLARLESRRLKGDPQPEPRLLRVVESWIKPFLPDTRKAILEASASLTMHILELDHQSSKQKRRREKRRRREARQHNSNKKHNELTGWPLGKGADRIRKKFDRDEGGLPIPIPRRAAAATARKEKRRNSKRRSRGSDADAVQSPFEAKAVGYVDCSNMSRGDEYEENDPSMPAAMKQLYEELKMRESWGGGGAADEYGDQAETAPLLDEFIEKQRMWNPDEHRRPMVHPGPFYEDRKLRDWYETMQRSKESSKSLPPSGDGYEEAHVTAADLKSAGLPSSGYTASSAVPLPLTVRPDAAGRSGAVAQDDNEHWVDASVATYNGAERLSGSTGSMLAKTTRKLSFIHRGDDPNVPDVPPIPPRFRPAPPTPHPSLLRQGPERIVPAASSVYSSHAGPPRAPSVATTALPYGWQRNLQGKIVHEVSPYHLRSRGTPVDGRSRSPKKKDDHKVDRRQKKQGGRSSSSKGKAKRTGSSTKPRSKAPSAGIGQGSDLNDQTLRQLEREIEDCARDAGELGAMEVHTMASESILGYGRDQMFH